jgi:iduronate 2-sulfatase
MMDAFLVLWVNKYILYVEIEMKKNNIVYISAWLLTLPAYGSSQQNENIQKRPNVLFICIDDLRQELGCYGSVVKTPNLDKLAENGSLFFHHYVQIPTSGASRASMLTGRLPRKEQDLSNEACKINLSSKKEQEQPETMFHHLRRNGYYTVGIGKISHYPDGYLYGYTHPKSSRLELPYSWDEMLFDSGKWETGWNAFFGYADGSNRQSRNKQVPPYECADVSDDSYPDGLTANLAIKKMRELSGQEKPFCLAVGFFKPHLPFTAPKKYWDLYDEKTIPLSPVPQIPEGTHRFALHNSNEFNGYLKGDEKVSLDKSASDNYSRKLRHAYFACISYVDAQVGKILDELERLGEKDNTIVIVWGDHGWHLGDQRVWGKHTLMDVSLRSTLIVRAPSACKAVKNYRIVSAVDIYPTLMELCNLSIPEGMDGHSFVELLENPNQSLWSDAAYSYFNNGISVRVPNYRLTRYWHKGECVTELYNYRLKGMEKKNIFSTEKKAIVDELIDVLERKYNFFHKAKP